MPKYGTPEASTGIPVKFCAFDEDCEPPDAVAQVIDWRAYEPPVTSEPEPVVLGSVVNNAKYWVPVNTEPSMVLADVGLRRAMLKPSRV
jgi:hypothetical protein